MTASSPGGAHQPGFPFSAVVGHDGLWRLRLTCQTLPTSEKVTIDYDV
ncbi:MAG: hypothetical protein ACR2GH_04285 [Pseudonocardia sp.]